MEVRRLTNLARTAAAVIAGRGLPLSVVRVADFGSAAGGGGGAGMAPRQLLFWRAFFQHLLLGCSGVDDVAAVFGRLGAARDPGALRASLKAFLRRGVGPWLAAMPPAEAAAGGGGSSGGGLSGEQLAELLRRLRAAERALTPSGGAAVEV